MSHPADLRNIVDVQLSPQSHCVTSTGERSLHIGCRLCNCQRLKCHGKPQVVLFWGRLFPLFVNHHLACDSEAHYDKEQIFTTSRVA